MIGLMSMPALLVLIFLRVPIGLAMFLVGLVGLVIVTGDITIPLARLKSETYVTFSNYSLSIVPMFLLMGYFATLGGMSQALFKAAEGWLGHRKGGVAMASIGIYAILTEQNIAKLFLAAFIPGVLAAIGYIVAISIYVRVNPGSAGTKPRVTYSARFRALFDVWPVLLVFFLVVGGIYLGWFTPTEGAAVGAFGTGLIALFAGGLTRSTLADSFYVTARASAMIFFIVFGAAFYNGFLALTQLPQEAAVWVADSGLSPLMILTIILVFYLLLGCLMDSLSMILLTVPIFWPVIQGLDFGLVSMVEFQSARLDALIASGAELPQALLEQAQALLASGQELSREMTRELGLRGVTEGRLNAVNIERTAIWFGILVLIVVEVGLITPPVGMNLFVINSMDRQTPIVETYKAVLYFVASDLLRVVILVAFPFITLALLPL